MRKTYVEEIEFLRTVKQPVILFGAGNTAEFNLRYFRELGIRPAAFCDNSKEKEGGMIDDLPILPLGTKGDKEVPDIYRGGVLGKYPEAYFYITVQLYYKEIEKQLLAAGVASEHISKFDIICQLPWEKDCLAFYSQNAERLQKIYDSLGDDESRRVLANRMTFFQTRQRCLMTDIRGKKQYFEEELINYKKIDTFVDLGTYTGDTIEDFLKISDGNYSRVYGFEPDDKLYETARQNLKDFKNIMIVNKGTSDFDGEVKVNGSMGAMQSIEGNVFGENETGDFFEVCKLDTYFENPQFLSQPHKIGMIKMDIEGAELATLKGAKRVIETNIPILAICVYHKQEDIFLIPEYLYGLSCGSRYKMYLRHYSDNQTETVAYFIPEY